PRSDGWTLDLGDRVADYDGVVLAIPAWLAGHILRRSLPDLAAPLIAVQRASSVVVSIALAPGTPLPDHSGVLVATGDSLRAKAFTFSSQKWPHLSGDD
ncbi:protoporphyrinogen oxidase, partial [Streptomyces sp. SID10244]|nr:protoporphyrinogen oxidase [Streptomyces sp. SID10244]